MATMRVIGNNLNRGYRDDLNWNFSKLETLLAESTSINDEFRREIQAQIDDLNKRLDDMDVTEILALISQMQQAIIDSNTATIHATTQGDYARGEGDLAKQESAEAKLQGTYAKDQGDYANEKTLLTIEATDKAIQETSNLAQMKIDVVQATQDANNSSTRANASSDRADKLVDNTKSRREFSSTTQYYQNNIVEYDGSSWIALKDGIGNALPVLPLDYNDFWHLVAEKGAKGDQGASFSPGATGLLADRVNYDSEPEGFSYLASDTGELYFREGATGWGAGIPFGKGEKGDPGAKGEKGDTGATGPAGATGNSYVIKGQFNDISELPATGQLGDGYLVGGDLYSWDGNAWILAGDIQGPQGEKGDGSDLTEVIKSINSLQDQSVGQDREIAWLKLQQEASDRIEGGNVFADDMNGNRFGFTLNEAESENIVIKDGKLLMLEKSLVDKTVSDGVVIASGYTTAGNGGRKLISLDDGTLIASVKGNDGSDSIFYYAFNGTSWGYLAKESAHSTSTWAIQRLPKNRFMSVVTSPIGVFATYYNKDGSLFGTGVKVDTITALGEISVVMSEDERELHLYYSCKTTILGTSFNLRYAKGNIVAISGVVSWSTSGQVSNVNDVSNGILTPSAGIDSNGIPYCIVIYKVGAIGKPYILKEGLPASVTGLPNGSKVINNATQNQSNISSKFVKESINGLVNGCIWVTWNGLDASGYSRIKTSFSVDGGENWSPENVLPTSAFNNFSNPSITANNKNEIFVVAEGNGSGVRLGMYKNENGVWGPYTSIKTGPSEIAFPSTLVDDSLDFSSPLLIYKDGASKVGFYGTWKQEVDSPSLKSKVVYDIPKTDFVGLYAKRNSPVFPRIKAYVNDIEMELDPDSLGIEPSWTKELPNDAPVKLKLELSRDTVTAGDSDYISRILGGRS